MKPRPSYGTSGAILIVDDDLEIRKRAGALLTDAGYQVFPADSSETALRLFHRHMDEITLLLVDVVAPLMSGPVLADQLIAIYPHLKVVYLSSWNDSTIVRRFVLDRGFPLLLKPFGAEALLAAVQSAIGSARRAAHAD